MAKYKAYPEYKDSGVEWLGEIPEYWSVSRLKHIASIYGRIGFRGYTVDDIVDEGEGALVLSPSNIEGDKFSTVKKTYLRWGKFYESPEIIVEQNDILLVKTGSTYGKSTIIKVLSEPMTINPQMALIKRSFIDSRFLAYLFNGSLIKAKIEVINTGSGMPTMTQENINHFPIPLPNHKYDIQIADFLDHETAKIDNLIKKQQQLIELLKEKRQAVISHAVTKGLNPDVPMKDSGVEWLGEVPEHWGVTTLSNLIRGESVVIQDGNHGELHPVAAEYVRDGIPFLMANNIRDRKVDLIECKRITKNRADKLRIGFAKAGDMLLTHKGTVGEVAIVPEHIAEPYWMLTPQVTYYRWANKRFDASFCSYLFQSKSIQTQLEIIGSKQSTRAYVGLIAQGELIVVIPPIEEQQAIRGELDSIVTRFDGMLAMADSSIELMQERRTALISAAVTGKIDVRDWVAPDICESEASQEATA